MKNLDEVKRLLDEIIEEAKNSVNAEMAGWDDERNNSEIHILELKAELLGLLEG